jgi:DNA-binding MarR family transcriptional regulator
MSLEKDINQTKFIDDYHKAMLNVFFTSSWMSEKTKSFFDTEQITAQQYNILRILRGAGEPISTLQIRQRMIDKMSDTSRIVDRLLAKDLVKKTTCPNDKRLVDVSITAKGKKLLAKLDDAPILKGDFCKTLSPTEAKTLNKLLEKLRG